jgi:hypothetical protein
LSNGAAAYSRRRRSGVPPARRRGARGAALAPHPRGGLHQPLLLRAAMEEALGLLSQLRATPCGSRGSSEARRCLNRLGELCNGDAALPSALHDVCESPGANAAKAVLDALRVHPADERVQQLGWGALALLCGGSEACRVASRRGAATKSLLAALAAHSPAPAVNACACAALASLTAQNASEAAAAASEGAMEALSSVLASHGSHVGATAHALHALHALCGRSARAAAHAHGAGAVEAAVEALRTHGARAGAVARPACEFLADAVPVCAASLPPHALVALAADAAAALRAHATHPPVQRAGFRLVAALATASDAAATTLIASGVVSDVFTALDALPPPDAAADDAGADADAVALRALACAALGELASRAPRLACARSFAPRAADVATAALRDAIDAITVDGAEASGAAATRPLQLLLALLTPPAPGEAADADAGACRTEVARAAVAAGALELLAPCIAAHHRAAHVVKRQRRELFRMLSERALADAAASAEAAAAAGDAAGGEEIRAAAPAAAAEALLPA